uniref:Amelogenin n=1 Tax=Salvator merianae TaxID=96440 RepID=A0A8D0KP57_SALMN
MRKMEGWTLLMCLLSTTFAVPLPQHPGFVNFSYEVMTPLKWYQNLLGPQLPHYGYEPMASWIQHSRGPMIPHPQFQMHHALHQSFPPMPQPAHNSFGPMPGPNAVMPQYVQPPQHPSPPQAAENPMQPHQPVNTNQPQHPQTGNTNQPIYPVHSMPPLIPDTPIESWPVLDKTKQEEVD